MQLQKYYAKKEDYLKNKELFWGAMNQMVTREVKMLSYQGKAIPK